MTHSDAVSARVAVMAFLDRSVRDGDEVRSRATAIDEQRRTRTRVIGLGPSDLAEGAYQLVLDVRDEVGLGRVERREPFTIAH